MIRACKRCRRFGGADLLEGHLPVGVDFVRHGLDPGLPVLHAVGQGGHLDRVPHRAGHEERTPTVEVTNEAEVGLPEGRPAIGVSISDNRHTLEGFHLLDARDGQVLWSKSLHRDGYVSMPFRMYGAPTAYDFDRDGVDDIGIDMLSYMAFLHGHEGKRLTGNPRCGAPRSVAGSGHRDS